MNVTIPPPTNVSPIAGYNHIGLDGADATAQPIKIKTIPNKTPCHDKLIQSPPISLYLHLACRAMHTQSG